MLTSAPIVTPARIQKALSIGHKGKEAVSRLARFVGSPSTEPWDIFRECEKPRARELEERERYILVMKYGAR